jgi:hypothetical protein
MMLMAGAPPAPSFDSRVLLQLTWEHGPCIAWPSFVAPPDEEGPIFRPAA